MENSIEQKKISDTWIEQIPGANLAFRYHIVSYLLMNVFFWLGWLNYGSGADLHSKYPWPFYPSLFGAVALICHFLAIYISPEKNRK